MNYTHVPPFRIRIFMILRNSFFLFFCLPGIFGWGCLSMLRAYGGRILTFSVLMNGGMPCHGNSVYHSLIFFSLFSQSLNIKDISMKVRKCNYMYIYILTFNVSYRFPVQSYFIVLENDYNKHIKMYCHWMEYSCFVDEMARFSAINQIK